MAKNATITQISHSNMAFSTRVMFFCAGLATASWAAIIPIIKANTGINDGILGLLLLCLGIGALIAMPLAGAITTKIGCKKVMLATVCLFSLILVLLPLATNSWLLAILLIAFGFGIGATDCVMNIQAILVEKQASKNLMSGFHGFYSLGGIFGAGFVATLLYLNLSALQACILVSLLILSAVFYSRTGLLSYANPKEGPSFALPKGPVLLISIVCFSLFLAEGTVLDWSGIYLTEYQQVPYASAALGLFCFSITMTIARLTGDKIIASVGARIVLTLGGLLASAGFFLAVLASDLYIALLGYALVGLGCANIVPIMFSATGKQTVMPQAIAVPAVTTLGYVGILAGPASVGQIAHYFSLPTALLVIAILIVAATALSTKIKLC